MTKKCIYIFIGILGINKGKREATLQLGMVGETRRSAVR